MMHHLDERLEIWEESLLHLLSQLDVNSQDQLIVGSVIIEQVATIHEMKSPKGECG